MSGEDSDVRYMASDLKGVCAAQNIYDCNDVRGGNLLHRIVNHDSFCSDRSVLTFNWFDSSGKSFANIVAVSGLRFKSYNSYEEVDRSIVMIGANEQVYANATRPESKMCCCYFVCSFV